MQWNHQLAAKKITVEIEKSEYPQKDATLSSWDYARVQGSWSEGGKEASRSKDPPYGEAASGPITGEKNSKRRTNSTQVEKTVEDLNCIDESVE